MGEKVYRITKETCQKNIRGVCSCCGRELEPIETVDNARNPTFWAGCNECQKFDNGVSQKVYDIAKRLVTERHYTHYSYDYNDTDSPEMRLYKQQSQISGACNVVRDVLLFAKQTPKTEGSDNE